MSSAEVWAPAEVGRAVLMARRYEQKARCNGLYEVAVQWQQYADSLEARGEVYLNCELMRRKRLDDT